MVYRRKKRTREPSDVEVPLESKENEDILLSDITVKEKLGSGKFGIDLILN